MTPQDLMAFERDIAERFNRGEIRAPVHLAGGNEDRLISIFKNIHMTDWVCGTWRSHYHCLLKGVPPERLMSDIVAGRSIALCYPEFRILCSAIVGGAIPIALGIAEAIKRTGRDEHVWAFLGDMGATTGIYAECWRYATGYKLPISFVIEHNGKSVCTDTDAAWGEGADDDAATGAPDGIAEWRYSYHLPWPHAGAGQRIQF